MMKRPNDNFTITDTIEYRLIEFNEIGTYNNEFFYLSHVLYASEDDDADVDETDDPIGGITRNGGVGDAILFVFALCSLYLVIKKRISNTKITCKAK